LVSLIFTATAMALPAFANPTQSSPPPQVVTQSQPVTNDQILPQQQEQPATPPPTIQAPKNDVAKTQSTLPMPQTTNEIVEQFNGNSLSGTGWEAVNLPKGYRNNEEQDYRPSQVKVADGMLQIMASRDQDGQWHSGELHSTWAYTYGDFEVRAALSASGPGVWPAAWLMGTTDQWPDGGEIDIFESINGTPTVFGTIHAGGSAGHWQQQSYASGIAATQFHTYKISKKPGSISWWVDGVKYGEWLQSQTPVGSSWPFETHSNFGLLNLAIGGEWPGPSNATTPSNITMFVDYFSVKNGS
jgi:beta-glucanase (GH16 family)